MKKSQGSIEFVIMIGAMLFFFTTFMLIIQGNIQDKYQERDDLMAKQIATAIQDEINLATKATDGYLREFTLPTNIFGKNYEIIIVENMVNIRTENSAVALQISEIILNPEKNITKGENTIIKKDGKVYINK